MPNDEWPRCTLQSEEGPRTTKDGAELDDAEGIIGVLAMMGRKPTEVASRLMLALAVVMVDTCPPEEHEAKTDAAAELLRQCVAKVQRDRAGQLAS